jgi:hypothetical protein
VNAVPLIVIDVPTTPDATENPVMFGNTVKLEELFTVPPGVVTLINPVVAFAGTVASIWVDELKVMVALTPLNVTVDAPVNVVPVIVTDEPITPLDGLKLLMPGDTVKFVALVPVPEGVVKVIVPVVAPVGTVAVTCVFETKVNEAFVPLNATLVTPVNA